MKTSNILTKQVKSSVNLYWFNSCIFDRVPFHKSPIVIMSSAKLVVLFTKKPVLKEEGKTAGN